MNEEEIKKVLGIKIKESTQPISTKKLTKASCPNCQSDRTPYTILSGDSVNGKEYRFDDSRNALLVCASCGYVIGKEER
jgi:DNA-directed RNA polymerase subunit M/transcription elongation factor TFIIS